MERMSRWFVSNCRKVTVEFWERWGIGSVVGGGEDGRKCRGVSAIEVQSMIDMKRFTSEGKFLG